MHFKIVAYSKTTTDTKRLAEKVPCSMPWELGQGARTLNFSGGYALNISSVSTDGFSTISQNTSQLVKTDLTILSYLSQAPYSDLYVQCTNPTGDTLAIHYQPDPPAAYGVTTSGGSYASNSSSISRFPPQIGYGNGVMTAGGQPFFDLPASFKNNSVFCEVNLQAFTFDSPIKLQGNASLNITQYCDTGPVPTDSPTLAPVQHPNTHSSHSILGPVLGGLAGFTIGALIAYRYLRNIYPQVNSDTSTKNSTAELTNLVKGDSDV